MVIQHSTNHPHPGVPRLKYGSTFFHRPVRSGNGSPHARVVCLHTSSMVWCRESALRIRLSSGPECLFLSLQRVFLVRTCVILSGTPRSKVKHCGREVGVIHFPQSQKDSGHPAE